MMKVSLMRELVCVFWRLCLPESMAIVLSVSVVSFSGDIGFDWPIRMRWFFHCVLESPNDIFCAHFEYV
jgi:hypothetical protein